jgi:hypothetical protein
MPIIGRVTDIPHLTRAWRTLDFKAAPTGWRAVYLDAVECFGVPVPGWLVQERYLHDLAGDRMYDDITPERRVIPAVCTSPDGWTAEAADLGSYGEYLWQILAPGEAVPTPEEESSRSSRSASSPVRSRPSSSRSPTRRI